MTSYLENDTLEGLPQMGTDLGDFLSGIAPGIGVFIIVIGVFAAIAAIVRAIANLINNKINF